MPLYIHFINVGQGDATYLRYEAPEEAPRHILVDGGPAESSARLIWYLQRQGVSRLHLVVATHLDDAHIGGLSAVLEQFPVARFWGPDPQRHNPLRPLVQPQVARAENGAPADSDVITPESLSAYDHLHALALNRDALVEYPVMGHNASYLFPGLELRVMGPAPHFAEPLHAELLSRVPPTQLVEILSADANNSSLVLRIGVNGQQVLLTGDAEMPAWHAMIDQWGAGLHARALKLSHHGSLDGTSAEVLGIVQPREAILSVGPNSAEHPAPQVLAMLTPPIQLYRTDQQGDIVLQFGQTEPPPPPPSLPSWRAMLGRLHR